jgi:hypothetical protein
MTNIASASLEPRVSEQGADELSLDSMRPGRFVLEAMQEVWPGEVSIRTLCGAQCTVDVFDWFQELRFNFFSIIEVAVPPAVRATSACYIWSDTGRKKWAFSLCFLRKLTPVWKRWKQGQV